MTPLIAITGGIGAGKSVVSRVLMAMGYPVYDCDSRAKAIMDSSPDIHAALISRIHPEAVAPDGTINRSLISEIVFNDSAALERLNTIVHTAVVNDVRDWQQKQNSTSLAFVETAILYKCELWKLVSEVWEVQAPMELRVRRVMSRNSLSREQVLRRINSQPPATHRVQVRYILNDDCSPVLPRINELLKIISD